MRGIIEKYWSHMYILLLQYQLLDMETNETDSSGSCFVSYKSIDPTSILKIKTDCTSAQGTPYSQHTDKVRN